MSTLDEKVHRIGGPAEKRGAPADKARVFDKVNARTGARKNRSVLKALEKSRPEQEYFALDVSEDPDYTMVLVMKAGLYDHDYYGVNVLFYPDGKIEASTGDSLADKQWAKDKREIIKVAKKQLKTGAPMGDTDADVRAYHGAGDGDYSGYKDKKMNESIKDLNLDLDVIRSIEHNISDLLSTSGKDIDVEVGHVQDEGDCFKAFYVYEDPKSGKERHGSMYFTARILDSKVEDFAEKSFAGEGKLTFKQFLLAEVKKIKEPGWYVCDHMDKPVSGPMQERGAKEEAEEKNAAHAAKHGKGDIPPFSAEYFSDYEIKRMNEAKISDAKRLAKQDPEAIMKAKAAVTKARKDGDEVALAKAKKKLAALTEGAELSAAQKKALMADFEEWSGGFTPDDCTPAQVKKYISSGMSTDLPKEAAVAYLKYIADNGARNAP